jgi:hypothetical protein
MLFVCYNLQNISPNKIGDFDITTILAEKNYHTIVFKKNANIFAENWQKSPEVVIITLTPELKKSLHNHLLRHDHVVDKLRKVSAHSLPVLQLHVHLHPGADLMKQFLPKFTDNAYTRSNIINLYRAL